MNDDLTLVHEFARSHSEAAFSALAARYVNLVYSVAQRQVNDSQLAEDVTQAVFIILAKKAGSLGPTTILSGWLCRTARYASANALTIQRRRQEREQEAYMQSLSDDSDPQAWEQIAPLLDDAMAKLAKTDHDALVLRFFEGRNFNDVGIALGTSEDAAKMRVNRALEKLRKLFSKRGVALTSGVVAGAISANSVHAAPATLAPAVTAVAIAKGSAVTATTLTLIKSTMKTMTWMKLKFALTAGLITLVAGGAATVAISQTGGGDGLSPQDIANKSKDAYAALSSYSDEGKTVTSIGTTAVAPHVFTIKLARPGLYRIEWMQDSGFYVQKGTAWSAGNGDFLKIRDAIQKVPSKESALAIAMGISGGATGSIPGTFFTMNWGNQFGNIDSSTKRKADEKIGGVDCYVLAGSAKGGGAHTLWIGKQDFLIHQIENDSSAAALKTVLDAQLKQHPELQGQMKSLPTGDTKSVETHTNIKVNQTFSVSDFKP